MNVQARVKNQISSAVREIDGVNLPSSWKVVSMANATDNFDGKRVPVKAAERSQRDGEFPYYGASGIIDTIDDFLFEGEYVLVGEDGANLLSRSTPIAFLASGRFWVNNHAHVIKARGVTSNAWVCSYLNMIDLRPFVTGSAQPKLTQAALNRLDLPIPPLTEQHRIVAKINSLSSKSKRAGEHLDHIPRLVEKYKQTVLAAAFRGGLVGLSAQSTPLPNTKCWELPAGWRWASFPEVAVIASNLVKPDAIPDLPHIAPDNIESQTGRLLPYRTIREDEVISPKHRFRPGQILYSKIRPYLRKAVLVDFEGACSADMYPLSPKEGISSSYLLYWLISEQFAAFTVEHEGRTVLPKINQQGLNSTWFPLAPLSVQTRIARVVGQAFEWIDRLTAEATSARKLIDRLDRVVLTKAFRGELVPQDPNDEPASVLLARIKEGHESASAARPRRARKLL